MQQDTGKTIGEIFAVPGLGFRQTLLSLKQHILLREEVQKWAISLRFVTVLDDAVTSTGEFEEDQEGPRSDDVEPQADSDASTTDTAPCPCSDRPSFNKLRSGRSGYLKVTERGDIPDCVHYVAVSYCWPQPPTGFWPLTLDRLLRLLNAILSLTSLFMFCIFGKKTSQLISNQPYIVRATSGYRQSRAPRMILDRAIKYAIHEGFDLIWIDQECIEQSNQSDKEAGIQSMDLVYQRASRPVGLLDAEIKTQAHLNALVQLVEGKQFTPEQYESAVEVLELLAQDRWLTRAWVLQEVVAGGETMELMIRCDPALEKEEMHFGLIPGEIIISLLTLTAGLGWMNACTSGNFPLALTTRAETAVEWLTSLTYLDSNIRSERNPEYRFICNGLQAFKVLSKRENTRVPDRLAILANLCNYPFRIDTEKLDSNTYSLSTCALALALFNGDISFLVGYSQALEENRKNATTDANKAFSWTPPASICLSTLGHFESVDHYHRIDCQLDNAGLLIRGWLLEIDTPVYLPNVQRKYSSLLSSLSNSEALDKYADILWYAIHELIEKGYPSLAQTIRASIMKNGITNIGEDHTLAQTPPASLSFAGYGFLVRRMMTDGILWCGEDAIYDVDCPTTVLCPKGEGMDIMPRPVFFRLPISFCIKRTGKLNGRVELLEGHGFKRGLWTIGDRNAETFIVT
ncbi:hypothetical protein GALMADRAFT_249965 [Galerina marginata CBS 339.88]|uniref:Heterokaryon incompatibility domain-containing protein n=1 Tax=Galerina marginata (strain CBS 339.88) TaxID=685588 RepID=A0A067T5C6_GALM3|nr:hypothetical protein GALMADRAFT_249965 [Galerina marginata CBS 339.88]